MLWTALSVSCAQTQLCSSKPVAMTVADSKDAAKLAKAALCDNAIIKAVWQGNVQLAETIVVGNGTSLTVTGASAQKAIIDGGNAVQLFNVWGALTIMNLTLINGYTVDFGGAIYNRVNTRVAIGGSVFTGHQASYGGAICSDSKLTISNSAFSNNFASKVGGAIYNEVNTTMTVSNTTFDSNTAVTGAGTIFAGNNSACTISSNSVFTNNTAETGAAVMIGYNSGLSVTDSEFSGNHAVLEAGCIACSVNSTVSVTGCMFSNNIATGASVIQIDSAVVHITASKFISNHAPKGGGAILIVSADSSAHISDSHFSHNTAQQGAAVAVGSGATVTINSSEFSYNMASTGGGSLYTEIDTTLTVTNTRFHANSARENGGGILSYSNMAVTACQFSGHEAMFGAAAMAVSNTTANITGCGFTNNSASATAGAIFIGDLCILAVSDCNFSNNVATNYAGSILVYTNSIANITNSSFTGGSAGVGGVLVTVTDSDVTLRGVHMSSNTGVNGGAINVQAALYVYNSSFANNTAQSRGGMLVGETSSTIEMYDSTMSTNTCQ
eukprot:2472-Heterococcus_DN1.PRE.1